MSDHNFEKQIQQKLDELKIPPSDHLWSSVEARIRKDRRRRRGVIFFPLFLLLLVAAGSYFGLQNYLSSTNNSVSKSTPAIATRDNTDNNNSTTETAKAAAELHQRPPGDKEVGNSIQPATQNRHEEEEVNENQSDHGVVQPVDLKKPVPENKLRIRPQTASSKSAKKKELVVIEDPDERRYQKNNPTVPDNRKQQVPGDNETINRNASEQGKSLLVGLSAAQEETLGNKQINTGPQSQTSKVAVAVETNDLDSAANRLARMLALPLDSAATLTTVEDSKAASRKIASSLKWGFSGSVGMSNLSEGGFFSGIFDILGVEKAMVADVSPIPNTGSNAGPAAVVYQPSEIEKGLSFSLGAFFQKNITKRISISTGLEYRFYSTHIRVGNRVDSFAMVQNAFGSMNINQYYRAAPVPASQEYTNRFHFVELPLSGHLQLNKGNRLPIFWNAGISLSYLVSTSVLHFDSRTGLYYKDNDLLNRLQTGMSTGFAVTLLNASRLSVQLGPQFQYNFTDLMKQQVSGGKHLFYFGLNTRVFLNK